MRTSAFPVRRFRIERGKRRSNHKHGPVYSMHESGNWSVLWIRVSPHRCHLRRIFSPQVNRTMSQLFKEFEQFEDRFPKVN